MDDAADVRIGSNVRLLRKAANMSARELGAKLDIDAESLLLIECGGMRAGINVLDRMSEIFSVPVWSFFEAPSDLSAPCHAPVRLQ
jgi:transcriptional regulator with XRE-family HTH domain